jgi:broad specificity phosphatase PhoE
VTRVLLLRHGAHDWLGYGIAGRLPGLALNAQGRAQAQELAQRLSGTRMDRVYASPQPRTGETVAPLAARLGLPVVIADEFDEIDFGQWTGQSMAQMQSDETRWRNWVEHRSDATPPGGEPFPQVAQRAMAGLERLGRLHPGQTVLVASHGDVIKAALAGCLGLSLDHLERFEIAPASLSVLAAVDNGWQVRLVNQALTGPLLPP